MLRVKFPHIEKENDIAKGFKININFTKYLYELFFMEFQKQFSFNRKSVNIVPKSGISTYASILSQLKHIGGSFVAPKKRRRKKLTARIWPIF